MDILLATKNEGKASELRALLAELPINIYSLNEFPQIQDVEETGRTFSQNAILKAQRYAKLSGISALADDSGLEVFALGRAPGIYSARYAGEFSTDEEKITKLLNALSNHDKDDRNARFVCVMAFANVSGEIQRLATGICPGKIALQTLGTKGFGYDPIFIPRGYENSFGQLSEIVKSQISHRARATQKIIRYLKTFMTR